MEKKTEELEEILTKAKHEHMSEILNGYDNLTLTDYLNRLMIDKNLEKSDIIKNAMLHRTYGYQIFQGIRQAGRDKIIQLTIGMNCDLDETNRVLTLAGHNRLYAKNKRDAVLIHAIAKKSSIIEIDEILNEFGMTLLCNYE